MSALKRPFDDQGQDRIWLETMAVLRILRDAEVGQWAVMNSAALELENARNPKQVRRTRVGVILRSFGEPSAVSDAVFAAACDMRALGFADMDALHLGFATVHRVDFFVTCDDGIVDRAKKRKVGVRVLTPIDFIRECGK